MQLQAKGLRGSGAGGGRKGAPCRLRGLRPARTQNRDGNLCRLKPLSLRYFVMAAGGH